MALPDKDTPWPPPDLAPYAKDQAGWAAWWSGDPKSLADTSDAGGSTGRRRFWQRRQNADATKATTQIHACLAADLAGTSADLLFGDPPDLKISETTTGEQVTVTKSDAAQAQARLEELSDTVGLPNRLLEAAEAASAMGGVYLRPLWNTEAADHPLLTVVDGDQGFPDFRFGVLSAVTFVETVHADKTETWRHLERHEPGVILHGLYVGTNDSLGRRVGLNMSPSTAGFTDTVPVPVELTGGRPGLLVRYVPNALPNRRNRRYPIGRSDFAGCESLLDALDETWTSWMRDLRLGQARILVADELMQQRGTGPGRGKALDLDTELFSGLNIPDLSKTSSENLIHEVQFAIRYQEHEATAMALTERIVSTAGYSPQTFGLHIEGRAESGTALRIRDAKTARTQGRKRRYWAPAIQDAAMTLLAIDRHIFRRPTVVARPDVEFPDFTEDPEGTARFVNMLRQAGAASTETLVRLAQPNLDEDQVDEEVARIRGEDGTNVPDPLDTAGIVPPTEDAAAIKAKADALGVLIRSGVAPEDAARRLGLEGIEFTGAVPVSLRMPTQDAASLEDA